MVYWGCGTDRNRLAWAWVALAGSAGVSLFLMGAAKRNDCNHEIPYVPECVIAPNAMLIAGAALALLALPPLLFFSGCAPPPEGDEPQVGRRQGGVRKGPSVG
jgi:hypothetical protein